MPRNSIVGTFAALVVVALLWLLARAPDAPATPDTAVAEPHAAVVAADRTSGETPDAAADPGSGPAATRSAVAAAPAVGQRPLPTSGWPCRS
jgi:hypothetical protein